MSQCDNELTDRELAIATMGVDSAGESISFAEQIRKRRSSLYTPPPGVSFAEYRETVRFGDSTVVERAEEVTVSGVPARKFTPTAEPAGTYVYLHGGGWCLGSHTGQDAPLQRLSDETSLRVLSIGYRLAPENPYPEGLRDVLAVIRNVAADEPTFLAMGGDSSGAHLAVLALLELRDNRERLADAVVLNYGPYDLAGTPSASDHLVEPASMLLPDVARAELRLPRYSPLYADLTGMPPARFAVGTRDYLADDTLMLEARWRQVAATELDIVAGAPHAFTASRTPAARLARHAERQFLKAGRERSAVS
ncbi:MAG: alpha/beta hydrolase [Nocardioidaceae bacterium]